MKPQSLLAKIAEATAVLFTEVTSDPLDEILGHLTAQLVREWIKDNSIGVPARKCVLYFDIEKRFVAAYLLTDDDSFIFLPSGKRVGTVFGARSMDDEMRQIFRSDNIVVITL